MKSLESPTTLPIADASTAPAKPDQRTQSSEPCVDTTFLGFELTQTRAALDVLTTPQRILSSTELVNPEDHPYAKWCKLYEALGFDEFVRAFTDALELSTGIYAPGLTPVHFETTKRIQLRPYLEQASKGKIVHTAYDNEHDTRSHLLGTIFTIPEIGKIVKRSATSSLRQPRWVQLDVMYGVDRTSLCVQSIWEQPDKKAHYMNSLATTLTSLCALTGVNHCTKEDILYYVYDQAQFLHAVGTSDQL